MRLFAIAFLALILAVPCFAALSYVSNGDFGLVTGEGGASREVYHDWWNITNTYVSGTFDGADYSTARPDGTGYVSSSSTGSSALFTSPFTLSTGQYKIQWQDINTPSTIVASWYYVRLYLVSSPTPCYITLYQENRGTGHQSLTAHEATTGLIAGGPYRLVFEKVDGVSASVDNVSVGAVPEPSSLMALVVGIGLLGPLALRRRNH